MNTLFLILLYSFVSLTTTSCQIISHELKNNNLLNIIKEWKLLEYGFPTERDRNEALASGNLVQQNGIPIDVAPHYNYFSEGDLRIFITIPKFRTGVPYSLATIRPNDQLLTPYPSYKWHNIYGNNCDGITSAFRVAFTPCNQMWVIDSGLVALNYQCPPQLLLFDLTTDQLLQRVRFNNTLFIPGASNFVTPIVQVRDPPPAGFCSDTMVYVADVTFHGLVVYDLKQNNAWRIVNKFMYPDPDYGTHTVAGESFTLMDGIFGMESDGNNLYFHPLASVNEYMAPLSILNNPNNWTNGANSDFAFTSLGVRRSECAAEALDAAHNLYCVTLNPIKLISWNTRNPYNERNFCELPANKRFLEFVSGMKVVRNFFGEEELWLLSNRFQKMAASTQNPQETNFRIINVKISDMLGNCLQQPQRNLHNSLIFH